jgi:hypothetical protein
MTSMPAVTPRAWVMAASRQHISRSTSSAKPPSNRHPSHSLTNHVSNEALRPAYGPSHFLVSPQVLEDGAFTKQHEGSLMKAILFAVTSIFVVTASATPSLARPLYQGSAESSSASGYQSRASRSAHRTSRYPLCAPRLYALAHRRAGRGHSTRSTLAVGARPARWCGWWMRTQKGGGAELNLARNWKNWGRPSGPRVGAVVVWSHHVGMVTGRTERTVDRQVRQ